MCVRQLHLLVCLVIWRSIAFARDFDDHLFIEPDPAPLVPEPESVHVLLYSQLNWAALGKYGSFKPGYLGSWIEKAPCDIPCYFSTDHSILGRADGVLFEAQPLAGALKPYLDAPIWLPQKRPQQKWINFGYEQHHYFGLYAEPSYLLHQDINMTFSRQSQVPVSFTCDWGGFGVSLFHQLREPPATVNRTGGIALIISNCGSGGAVARLAFMRELMRYVRVDSLGGCLHNTDMPDEMQAPIYSDHGASMRNKIKVLSRYKFVMTLENNNVTDYVTEKVINVFQAGAVPVYMGSETIEDWLPGERSIVRTDQFANPKALAEHLQFLLDNPDEYAKYFEWKRRPFRDSFLARYRDCVFHTADCRLCHEIRRQQTETQTLLNSRLPTHLSVLSRAAIFPGAPAVVEVPHSVLISFTGNFSIAAWIWFNEGASDVRLVDKGVPGTVLGYNLDLQEEYGGVYLRLCCGSGCFLGTRPLSHSQWYFVAVTHQLQPEGLRFYVNGVLDFVHSNMIPPSPTETPLRLGASSAGHHFPGVIDDVSLWSTILSAEEITRLMFKMPGGMEPGLAVYYSFNELSDEGSVIHDHSPHALHGVPRGGVYLQTEQHKPFLVGCF